MATDPEIDTLQKVAIFLDMGYMALYKVMDGTNNPTTDLCITLCRKAGYSANWMFLSEGHMYWEEQAQLNDIAKQIQKILSRFDLKTSDGSESSTSQLSNKIPNKSKRNIKKTKPYK